MPLDIAKLRLWVLSDLHLEDIPYPDQFDPKRPDFDVLVSAGDIFRGDIEASFRTLRRLALDKPVVAVLGNHEFWNQEISEAIEIARGLAIQYGVTLLENDVATYAGVTFFGATMWTDGRTYGKRPDPEAATGEQIAYDGENVGLLTLGDVWRINTKSRAALETALLDKRRGAPMVVITHHAPLPECMPDPAANLWSTGNSTSNLRDWTDTGIADLWIHGHIHVSNDFQRPHGTRIVSNAAGGGFANHQFQDDLVVEVRVPNFILDELDIEASDAA